MMKTALRYLIKAFPPIVGVMLLLSLIGALSAKDAFETCGISTECLIDIFQKEFQ